MYLAAVSATGLVKLEGGLGDGLSSSQCNRATSPLGDTSLEMRPFSRMSDA